MSDECNLLATTAGACQWCGTTLTGRRYKWCSKKCARKYTANHRWTQAKVEAKGRVTYYQCEHCGDFVQQVEVNHIIPCLGKHGTWGCHHHQDNLEVLCKPCHKAVTAQQRRNGAFK